MFWALVDGIPALKGQCGRPRKRPVHIFGDRAYDKQLFREMLRKKAMIPHLAKRNEPHGSGLGVYRWVVERTLSWLHQLKRLRVRFERRADIHEAFLLLGCAVICLREYQLSLS
jgi:transposase